MTPEEYRIARDWMVATGSYTQEQLAQFDAKALETHPISGRGATQEAPPPPSMGKVLGAGALHAGTMLTGLPWDLYGLAETAALSPIGFGAKGLGALGVPYATGIGEDVLRQAKRAQTTMGGNQWQYRQLENFGIAPSFEGEQMTPGQRILETAVEFAGAGAPATLARAAKAPSAIGKMARAVSDTAKLAGAGTVGEIAGSGLEGSGYPTLGALARMLSAFAVPGAMSGAGDVASRWRAFNKMFPNTPEQYKTLARQYLETYSIGPDAHDIGRIQKNLEDMTRLNQETGLRFGLQGVGDPGLLAVHREFMKDPKYLAQMQTAADEQRQALMGYLGGQMGSATPVTGPFPRFGKPRSTERTMTAEEAAPRLQQTAERGLRAEKDALTRETQKLLDVEAEKVAGAEQRIAESRRTFVPETTPFQRGTAFREALEAEEQGVWRPRLDELQSKIDYGAPVDVKGVQQEAKRILRDRKFAEKPGSMPESLQFATELDQFEVPVPGIKEGQTSLDRLLNLRQRVYDDIKQIDKSPDPDTFRAKRLREYADSIDETLRKIRSKEMGTAAGQAYDRYAREYATFKDRFYRDYTDEIQRMKGGRSPGERVEPSNVFDVFTAPDSIKGAAERAKEFRAKYGRDKEMMRLLSEDARARAAVDPERFRETHKAFLEEFPNIDREIQSHANYVGQATTEIETVQQRMKDLQRLNDRGLNALDRGTLANLATTNPESLAKVFLGAKNPEQEIRATIARLKGTVGTDVTDSLRSMVLRELTNRTTGGGVPSFASADRVLKDGKFVSTVRGLYGEDGLRAMRNYRDALRIMERTKVPEGAAALNIAIDIDKDLLGSLGLSIPMLMSRLYNLQRGVVGFRWFSSDLITRMLYQRRGKFDAESARKMMVDAWSDPELAEALTLRINSPKDMQRVETVLDRYLGLPKPIQQTPVYTGILTGGTGEGSE